MLLLGILHLELKKSVFARLMDLEIIMDMEYTMDMDSIGFEILPRSCWLSDEILGKSVVCRTQFRFYRNTVKNYFWAVGNVLKFSIGLTKTY